MNEQSDSDLQTSSTTVALMFGRGGRNGSQSIPGKNLLPILGRPIMEYPLLAAKHARSISRIFLSTDDTEIAAIGRQHGAVIIERPPSLASSAALMEDAIAHGFSEVLNNLPEPPFAVVILMCNAPCILPEQIDLAVDYLRQLPELDSVTTAAEFNMFNPVRARRASARSTLEPVLPVSVFHNSDRVTSNRESSGEILFGTSGATASRTSTLMRISENQPPFPWMGSSVGYVRQIPGAADLDAPWQIPVLEYWLTKHGFSIEGGTPYDQEKYSR